MHNVRRYMRHAAWQVAKTSSEFPDNFGQEAAPLALNTVVATLYLLPCYHCNNSITPDALPTHKRCFDRCLSAPSHAAQLLRL